MLQRRFLPALVILALAAFAFGQDKDKDKDKDKPTPDKTAPDKATPDKAKLVWNFKEGEPFYQKMTTTTHQDMSVQGNKVSQQQNQTFYFVWTPEKKDGDTWIIKQKIDGVAMEIDIGGNKISYDSTKDNNPNSPLGDFFKALVGTELKYYVSMPADKDITVTRIEGRDEFIKKLSSTNPPMAELLKQILSADAMKEMAAPTFAALPNKEVDAKADSKTWKRTSTLDMGPIGKYENTYTYTFEGKGDKDLDKIKVETKLNYKEPAGDSGTATLPFKIRKAKLDSKPSTGSILYNPAAGRIEKSSLKLELDGELEIEIGGQTTPVKLTQTQETTVDTGAKSFIPTTPATPPAPPAPPK
jgi:Family of unknown function (DUF6263)